MYNIPKPNLSYKSHFAKCINVRDTVLRVSLENVFPELKKAANSYNKHARDSSLYKMIPLDSSICDPVTDEDLKKLYTQQMVVNGRPARSNYDRIMITANGRCPYCSHNYPKTLDHYLAKTEFPEFSVLPINLVPSCWDCNHGKRATPAINEEEQFIHPYYDDISQPQWLEANVVFSRKAPTIVFHVNETATGLEKTIYKRINYQFGELKLNTLYSKQAANELSGIDYNLRNLHSAGGAIQVKSHLQTELESRSRPNKNSWQAAMYRCISENDTFCDMNWSL